MGWYIHLPLRLPLTLRMKDRTLVIAEIFYKPVNGLTLSTLCLVDGWDGGNGGGSSNWMAVEEIVRVIGASFPEGDDWPALLIGVVIITPDNMFICSRTYWRRLFRSESLKRSRTWRAPGRREAS